jgi:hypothetical protein
LADAIWPNTIVLPSTLALPEKPLQPPRPEALPSLPRRKVDLAFTCAPAPSISSATQSRSNIVASPAASAWRTIFTCIVCGPAVSGSSAWRTSLMNQSWPSTLMLACKA